MTSECAFPTPGLALLILLDILFFFSAIFVSVRRSKACREGSELERSGAVLGRIASKQNSLHMVGEWTDLIPEHPFADEITDTQGN